MADVDQFKIDLIKMSVDDVYNKYLIGGDIWYFSNQFHEKWFDKYNSFKLYITDKLKVHYNDISIAGSAKLGFSINPQKKFSPFHQESDIDVIIISQTLFYKFWGEYLNENYSIVRVKNYSYVCSCIFRKFITFKGFNNSNKAFKEWEIQTRGFEKNLQLNFSIAHDIHYRIFESWDAAKAYYISGMEQCKQELLKER